MLNAILETYFSGQIDILLIYFFLICGVFGMLGVMNTPSYQKGIKFISGSAAIFAFALLACSALAIDYGTLVIV